MPTINPSAMPTVVPTVAPSVHPSAVPSWSPTEIPTATPSEIPTQVPTVAPTVVPTVAPTVAPTVVPTVVPTSLPTATPSVALPNYPFRVKQSIHGMSLGNYDIDAARNSATFKTAISETMPGVVSSDIRNFDVIAGSFKDSSLPADFIILHYDVDVPSKLWQKLLNDAVADGSFDNYLRAAALNSGATNLEGASGGTIATHTIEDDESNNHQL
eukprot:gene36243-41003_t